MALSVPSSDNALLQSLTQLSFSDSAGSRHAAHLHVPAASRIYPLIYEPMYHDADTAAHLLPLELRYIVETIDDEEVTFDGMKRLLTEDTPAFRSLLMARNRLYETLASEGRVIFGCPHCEHGTVTFDVLSLTLALNVPPWPIFDGNGIFMAYPSLATDLEPGRRPDGISRAASIGFEAPSSVVGLESPVRSGTLDTVSIEEEEAAREQWEVPFLDPPEGKETWTYERPAFRAVLRLCLALRAMNEAGSMGVTPELFTEVPVPDFFFLDNIYYLTHNVDVEAGTRARSTCGTCGGEFLPVA